MNDHRQIAAHGLHFFEEFDAVHAGHDQVEDHQFDAAAAGAVEGFEALKAAIHSK